jgi:hypothetical protein
MRRAASTGFTLGRSACQSFIPFDGIAVAEAIHATARARLAGQIRPSKTKQKCLDSLGFIRPNRDFSMSYGKKNKKIPVSWFLAAGRLARCGFDLPRQQTYTTDSDFRKEIALRLFASRFQRVRPEVFML